MSKLYIEIGHTTEAGTEVVVLGGRTCQRMTVQPGTRITITAHTPQTTMRVGTIDSPVKG